MGVEVLVDGLLELARRAMHAAADVFLGERCEPILGLVQPRRGSGRHFVLIYQYLGRSANIP